MRPTAKTKPKNSSYQFKSSQPNASALNMVRAGMVATPWGNSDSLRDRRLRPGPGVPREDVVSNQRERLFGAIVASVSERGYTATTVGDLVEISGVSSRTFYDLFGDKKACFIGALEAMIQAAVIYAAQSVGEGGGERAPGGVQLPEEPEAAASWEEQARRGFDAFAEMVAVQPAAARMALVEANAAGPEALVPIEQAVAGFEWLTRQMLEQSPERAEMPAEMISAHVGAVEELARTRLRRGTEAELPGLTDELWALMLSYAPPPEPLKLGGRLPKPQPESIDAHDHAERALRAFTAVVAEQGYINTTVDAVLRRAQMSATTFYAHFRGKEDAMLSAIDSAGAQLVAAVLPAFRRAPGWPEGIRAGFGAMFNFLASRPALARLIAVEIYAAGPDAVQRRSDTLQPLEALIAEGRKREPAAPTIAPEAIAGAVYSLTYRRIRDDGPEALPGLAPICTYIALAPFIGAEQACSAANGDGRGRGALSSELETIKEIAAEPLRAQVLTALTNRPANIKEIAKEINEPPEAVGKHIDELRGSGLVEAIEAEAGEPTREPTYQVANFLIGDSEAAQTSLEEREKLSAQVVHTSFADVNQAIDAGTLDARTDRHLSWIQLHLDEQGWREMVDLHATTMEAILDLNESSSRRLAEANEKGLNARSITMMFEMPDP